MSVTTTSSYGSMSDRWAHRALLQRSKPRNVHNLFGRAFTLPQKNTDTMAFRRQENLNSDPVVLTEGADPAPEQIQKFDINVQIQEFGKVVLLSRKVILVVEDDTRGAGLYVEVSYRCMGDTGGHQPDGAIRASGSLPC